MAAIQDISFCSSDENWFFSQNQNDSSAFEFKLVDSIRLVCQGCFFDLTDESAAIVKKSRHHNYMDVGGHWVDYKATIPYGSEPVIARTCELINNHCKVTTDVNLKNGFPYKEFAVDTFSLQGNWKQIGFCSLNGQCIEWTDFSGANYVEFYNSTEPFMVCLLKDDKDTVVEVGFGNDIWRWMVAESIGAESQFLVAGTSNEVCFKRIPVSWPTEQEYSRNWRFKWYFSWQTAEDGNAVDPNECVELSHELGSIRDVASTVFELPKNDWPDDSVKIVQNQKSDVPCYHASAVKRYMKRWVRCVADNYENETLLLHNLKPGICESASHMDRPKKKQLFHVDIWDLLEFQFWANKQLSKRSVELLIGAEGSSIYSQLPSMNYRK